MSKRITFRPGSTVKFMRGFTLGLLALLWFASPGWAGAFASDWADTPDRIWAGPDYWANPMEAWRIADGGLECAFWGPNHNVAVLTRSLTGDGAFEITLAWRPLDAKHKEAYGGLRIGVRDELKDYRAAALRGRGLDVGVGSDGYAFVDGVGANREQTQPLAVTEGVRLSLRGEPVDQDFRLTLRADDGQREQTVVKRVPAQRVGGLVSIVANRGKYRFDSLGMSGEGVGEHADRAWGPILWTMHTLHQTHGAEGAVLKMTAQLPPMGQADPHIAALLVERENGWQEVAEAEVDPHARTATFRVIGWDARRAARYRVVYGKDRYEGTIRAEPVGRPLTVAGFTGNQDYVFPNALLAGNLRIQDPDILFFSGDQIYEPVGGYGIIREPADRSTLNYLRKWYLLGWAFGDLMRDRPTVCLPDDHDVYHGNIWGEGGEAMPRGGSTSTSGGFRQPVEMVNAVIRTQTAHHPDPADPADREPMKRGIDVFYGPMLYGGVSFALLEDRYFKSAPGRVSTWGGRADHLKDPDYDVSKLDKPGLELLGARQEAWLKKWAGDWRGAQFKCVLSQTIFCNLANYHGPAQEFIYADLDSNGWPQSGRRRALEAMRSGYAFHYAGDQHLPSITRNGIDTWNDAGFAFCVPSIAAGYPRSWLPDQEGRPVRNRPEPGLPNTGEYRDGFGNYVTVYGIGNPAERNRPGRVNTAHDKSSGHGMVHFDPQAQTITMACYRLQFDARNPRPEDQFPGWPKTIHLRDNDGRKVVGTLPAVTVPAGIDRPVLKVKRDGELVYALRLAERTVRPWVYGPGEYLVELGEGNRWTRVRASLDP